MTWHLDEELALNAGYAYTRIDRGTVNDDTVDSNAVFVSLGYSWPRMSMSR
jgi:long-subunit fatty acid transport protein